MKYEMEYKGKTYPVKFRHERRVEKQISQDEHGKDIIVEEVLATGGLTIAYIKLEDETILNAETECSRKDIYSKHMGRRISFGRLQKSLQEGTPY